MNSPFPEYAPSAWAEHGVLRGHLRAFRNEIVRRVKRAAGPIALTLSVAALNATLEQSTSFGPTAAAAPNLAREAFVSDAPVPDDHADFVDPAFWRAARARLAGLPVAIESDLDVEDPDPIA